MKYSDPQKIHVWVAMSIKRSKKIHGMINLYSPKIHVGVETDDFT